MGNQGSSIKEVTLVSTKEQQPIENKLGLVIENFNYKKSIPFLFIIIITIIIIFLLFYYKYKKI